MKETCVANGVAGSLLGLAVLWASRDHLGALWVDGNATACDSLQVRRKDQTHRNRIVIEESFGGARRERVLLTVVLHHRLFRPVHCVSSEGADGERAGARESHSGGGQLAGETVAAQFGFSLLRQEGEKSGENKRLDEGCLVFLLLLFRSQ